LTVSDTYTPFGVRITVPEWQSVPVIDGPASHSVEVSVRRATLDDGDAIGAAHGAAWLAAYGHIFDATFLNAAAESRRVGWPRAMERLLGPPNLLLVGELDHRVVAFAHAAPLPDRPTTAEIRGFYSHPDAWGTGIAPLLMTRTCVALAEDFANVTLWTLRDAHRARRFYEKVGFCATGNIRSESLSDWTTGTAHEAPTIEYARPLHR
jgi:GNAT superfamily N-acetyltransferase